MISHYEYRVESDDENFEDAQENLDPANDTVSSLITFKRLFVNKLNINEINEIKIMTDEDGTEECIKSALYLNQFFFNNHFDSGLTFGAIFYKKNVFYSLFYSTLSWIKAWMSFEEPDIIGCVKILESCSAFINSKRKHLSWSEWFRKINYNLFTDEEVHAELAFAEVQFLLGTITFVKDQNFSSLFKGAYKFKVGYQSYKNCREILENRNVWESELARREFKTGLQAGNGLFHLTIANAPPKILAILEFMGISCEESRAIETLMTAAKTEGTIRSSYALLAILTYYCYMQISIGWGEFDIDQLAMLIKMQTEKYPNSIFTKYFTAKYLQLSGNLDSSHLNFQQFISCSNKLPQINNACNWELLWILAAKKKWLEGAEIANHLRKHTLWSPCVFNYLYAAFLCMHKKYDDIKLTEYESISKMIENALREVPSLRRRLAGKSTPIEKFVMAKSEYYFKNQYKLYLPILEVMFFFNLESSFSKDKYTLNTMLEFIEEELKVFQDEEFKQQHINDFCLLLVLKSSYLRLLNFPMQAIESLNFVLINIKQIKESHLPPFATMELAFCYLKIQDFETAKFHLKNAIAFNKYTAELILHFRAFYALKYAKAEIKSKQNQ